MSPAHWDLHAIGDRWSLLRGDCLGVMRDLAADPHADGFDAIVCDPPYCSGGSSPAERAGARKQGRTAPAAGWFEGDNMSAPGLAWQLRELASLGLRSLRPGGSILIFADWRMVPTLAPAIESAGLRMRNLVVWDKGSPSLGRGFRPQHELVMHFSRRTIAQHRGNLGNVLRHPRPDPAAKRHPCEKPVGLLRDLIEVASPPGGTILDPYCGSGSTGEAAVSIGRRFIGCDQEPRFLDAAAERLRAAALKAREVA